MSGIYSFKLELDWKLINQISHIDRFGGSWEGIEKREAAILRQLKSIATVRSVGASTRIEGSKMNDDQVEVLIKNLDIKKLEERDQQEVAGYFEVLDIISASFRDIDISENSLKHLHNQLMKYSEKDSWHKGDYKQVSNEVEATNPDGSKYTIFKTSEPGIETQDLMRNLVQWYKVETDSHPLVKSATFIYEFLSIHPFQDGNGRLSRLLATLLLLKHGYSWIEYVSFEHEIENRKAEYYRVLMNCQRQRPGENILDWMMFFLNCLATIQQLLMKKLEVQNVASRFTPRKKKVYQFIENLPGAKSGQISESLDIPLPTVKKMVAAMVEEKLLQKHGTAAGTNYTVEAVVQMKKDLVMKFSNDARIKEIQLNNSSAFIEIKKFILSPKFEWIIPDEWAMRLIKEGLYLEIKIVSNSGSRQMQSYALTGLNNPYLFQPVFTLSQPINIPKSYVQGELYGAQFPIRVSIELQASVEEISFDVLAVYDESE